MRRHSQQLSQPRLCNTGMAYPLYEGLETRCTNIPESKPTSLETKRTSLRPNQHKRAGARAGPPHHAVHDHAHLPLQLHPPLRPAPPQPQRSHVYTRRTHAHAPTGMCLSPGGERPRTSHQRRYLLSPTNFASYLSTTTASQVCPVPTPHPPPPLQTQLPAPPLCVCNEGCTCLR
jgi:hypothetical protein